MTPAQFTDLALLKVFMRRDVYNKYFHFIKLELMDYEIKTLLLDFGAYFEKFDRDEIDLDDFPTWFHHSQHADITETKHQIYKLIFEKLPDVKTEVAEEVLHKMQQMQYAEQAKVKLEHGFDADQLRSLIEDYEIATAALGAEDEDVISNDLRKILEVSNASGGLTWKLSCLNGSIGPLVPGMLIVIAAYVDVGKTALAISEAAHMARQLPSGCVLWLNNEEDNSRVYKKIWRSVLGCDDETLTEHTEEAIKLYKERMHGNLERIKFIDIRKKSFTQLKKLFDRYKPKLCVIDQVDKIPTGGKFFSDHDRLKNLYSEMRGLANEYCPILAISQADVTTTFMDKTTGDIHYRLYPHHRQLDASKVGKPGEADAIIMIGRRAEYPNTRGIHVSKNKFGDTIKAEVIFDGGKVRYENP